MTNSKEELMTLKKDAENTLRQSDRSVTEIANAIDIIRMVEDAQWKDIVDGMMSKFTPQVMHKLIEKEMLATIQKLRDYREGQYILNDELRMKGMTFVDRMQKIDNKRIEWTTQYESKLTQDLKNFKVRPFNEWLDRLDLKFAKERGEGMGLIIRGNLSRCYIVNETNGNK